MRATVGLLVLLSTLLAGCGAPGAAPSSSTASPTTTAPPPCPDEAQRRSVYEAAERFFKEDLLETTFTMRFEGTLEGTVGTMILALDPQAKSLRVSEAETDFRVVGNEFSIESPDVSGHGRNHEPGAQYQQSFDLLKQAVEEPEPRFFDDLTVDDYTASCVEHGGVQAVRYVYEKDGRKDVNVAERAAPHRPLSGEVVDPALQDNYRASVAYAKPSIAVDTSLERLALHVIMEVISYAQNSRGGLNMIAELDPGTQWAPFSQVQSQLVDSEGTVYVTRTLQAGVWDLGNGNTFDYQDKDGNGMVSTGDRFSMDLAPGLDVAFYDLWASRPVALEATAA